MAGSLGGDRVTSLGRWLVDILNAHIERHNVPAAEPAPDTPLARFYIGQLGLDDMTPTSSRPCPICGCHAAMSNHWCAVKAGVIVALQGSLLNADGSTS